MKKKLLGLLPFGILLCALTMRWERPKEAWAATQIASTTTYGGVGTAAISAFAPVNLPNAGAYTFGLNVSNAVSLSNLIVYIQQVGISGARYTLNASTFTTMSGTGYAAVSPDVYEGGQLLVQWSVTSGSATFTVNANQVLP